MKPQLTRKFYIPSDAFQTVNIESKGLEVWEYTSRNGQPAALVFHGKAQKPDWHYRFYNEAQREAKIKDWLEAQEYRAEVQKERKAKQSAPTTLQVGDILHGSWGYDQTNCDFFQVTGRKGARGVYVRPIAAETVKGSEGFMCEHLLPLKDHFWGKETYHITTYNGESIRYNPSESDPRLESGKYERRYLASKWDGSPCYSSHYA